MPAYFDARFGDANIEAVAFADSPRVDPRSRPCKRKEAPAMARYAADGAAFLARAAAPKTKFAYDFGACAAHRCVDSVNGGFLYSRARGGAVDAALEAWFADCGAIWERRANQPSLVAALRGAACAYDAGGAGSAAPHAWRPANATSFLGARRPKLVVANQDLFVSGRRGAFARDAVRRGALLAFHANFRFGWRAQCDLLRKLGLLFVETAGDVCADPAGFECAATPRSSADSASPPPRRAR